MGVLGITEALARTDHASRIYQELVLICGISTGSIVDGTLRDIADRLLAISRDDSDDVQIEEDLNPGAYAMLTAIPGDELFKRQFFAVVLGLDEHYGNHGDEIDDSISTWDTMLSYYNGGGGGAAFSHLADPYYSDIIYSLAGERPTASNYFGKGIHPGLNGATMGDRVVGGDFNPGQAYDSNYAELVPLIQMAGAFSGGSAPPTVTVAGVDNTGAATTTWSATLTGNNPLAGFSTTLTDVVVGMNRVTVPVASITGIVPGSVVIVDSGTEYQEIVVIEEVSGLNITAVFRKSHSDTAAVSGQQHYTLTPSVAGRRIRSVTDITIGTTGHSAGTVSIVGRRDRVAI